MKKLPPDDDLVERAKRVTAALVPSGFTGTVTVTIRRPGTTDTAKRDHPLPRSGPGSRVVARGGAWVLTSAGAVRTRPACGLIAPEETRRQA
jgi:hypothetical protein